jgi:hypothetical protein
VSLLELARRKIEDDLATLESRLANAKTQLGYSEMSFRDLKIQENEPAWFADSISSSAELTRDLEFAHGSVISSRSYVKRIKKEIFTHKMKHGN